MEAFRYRSARDPESGTNVGVFTPTVFAARRPEPPETWYCVATRAAVELSPRSLVREAGPAEPAHRFPRDLFEVDGVLPAPSL